MDTDRLLKKLARCIGNRLVTVERSPCYADDVTGYVVGVGRKWLLVARTAEGGALTQGWIAVRLADVTAIRRQDRRFFGERYGRSSPGWPPRPPQHPVDLDSTRGLLTSMAWNAPLLGFEQEHHRRAIWIGLLMHHERHRSVLLEVTPTAAWKNEPYSYPRGRISAVSIGGDYLTALDAVAGPPPADVIEREIAAGATMPAAHPPQRVLRVFFDWGHPWPLWESGYHNYANSPADYDFSPAAIALMQQWRDAWHLVADPDSTVQPTGQQRTRYRHAAANAIRQIKLEAPDGIVIDTHRYPAA